MTAHCVLCGLPRSCAGGGVVDGDMGTLMLLVSHVMNCHAMHSFVFHDARWQWRPAVCCMLNLAAALAAFAAGCIVMHCSKNNPHIVSKLEAEGIDFLQFAFRWVNCLLIREVPFNAAIRLWDTYLAEGGRFSDFLVRLQLLVLL